MDRIDDVVSAQTFFVPTDVQDNRVLQQSAGDDLKAINLHVILSSGNPIVVRMLVKLL